MNKNIEDEGEPELRNEFITKMKEIEKQKNIKVKGNLLKHYTK